jgi:hypothetical protein
MNVCDRSRALLVVSLGACAFLGAGCHPSGLPQASAGSADGGRADGGGDSAAPTPVTFRIINGGAPESVRYIFTSDADELSLSDGSRPITMTLSSCGSACPQCLTGCSGGMSAPTPRALAGGEHHDITWAGVDWRQTPAASCGCSVATPVAPGQLTVSALYFEHVTSDGRGLVSPAQSADATFDHPTASLVEIVIP